MRKSQSGFSAMIIVAAIVVLLLLGIGAWLAISHQVQPQKKATVTSITYPSSNVAEDLVFGGMVNGHMPMGARGNGFVCTPAATGPIVGVIGRDSYTFEFTNVGATGAGSYTAYVQIGKLPQLKTYYGGNIPLTINADLRSGRVEGDLKNLQDQTQQVHIVGNWKCPAS
ncbi:MAG TPA: hypothetical protein VNG90_05370 [Candidatus Acidoferrum sp.]|nr:hypothetical protein [Candidatus Acidoferrum sp.]